MDVRIGIIHSPREVSFETQATAQDITNILDEARKSEGQFAVFTDQKGTQILVNPAMIAYVELAVDSNRRVGFVN